MLHRTLSGSAPGSSRARSGASRGCTPQDSPTSSTRRYRTAAGPGPSRVRVTIEDTEGALSVTVTDDGAGVADPAVLLSFGENGWSEELACNVRTRPGWEP